MEGEGFKVVYESVDGYRKVKKFKTLKGAQKYAQDMVGEFPSFGGGYAVSGDGVGMVFGGHSLLKELFPKAYASWWGELVQGEEAGLKAAWSKAQE